MFSGSLPQLFINQNSKTDKSLIWIVKRFNWGKITMKS